jgi:signal transduction histidine kinase
MIEGIEDSGRRLLNLINDILDLAKIQAGRLDIVSTPIVLRDMVSQWQSQMDVLAKQRDLAFEVDVDPQLPEQLYGDTGRITQIAINLLSNAFKFTEKGRVKLELKPHGDAWVLEVCDTGVGIPPHALQYIFDEFRQVDGSSQRTHGGTGLGLAIVRNLCVAMGGTVQVSSTLGEGSTFTVTLPLHPVTNPAIPEIVGGR